MNMTLTHDAIQRLIRSEGKKSDSSFVPTLQIIRVVKVAGSNNQQERFRTVLSDGKHFVHGMLATQHNHLVHSNQLVNNSVIRLVDYMNNLVQGKVITIILGLEVINVDPGQKFGDPVEAVPSSGEPNNSYAKPMYNSNKPQQTLSSNTNPYGNQPQNRYGSSAGHQPTPIPSAPIVRSNTSATGQPITPIASLNMYQNRWTIKARVTSKSDIRTWSNAKGEGQLFSIELLDSSAVDIKATFFKEAVDKFYNLLQIDKVYSLSGGRLKVASAQWNTCKSGFEITFDQNSEIHLDNDTGDIQQQIYEVCKIAEIEQVEPGNVVDIVGVIKTVGPVGTITSKKTGNEITKCELVLVDDSGVEINCTVWGDRAEKAQTEYQGNPIVAIRRARVSDFGGRSLSASNSSNLNRDPRIPEAQRVRQWWATVGSSGGTRSLSSSGGGANRFPNFEDRKTISAIKGENLGTNPEKPDWISFKGSFNFIKSDKEGGAWYTACPNAEEPCKNRYKVTQGTDGMWFCERCQRSYETCVRRFIFSATVTDDTCTTWVSMFDDQARVLMDGVSADEVHKALEDDGAGGQDLYNSYFSRANFTDWVFTCKVKQEMNQDEMRVKTSVYSLHPMDYAKEGRSLLNSILKMP